MKIKKVFRALFNLLFPGKCDLCGAVLSTGDSIQICAACVNKLRMPDGERLCPVCGHPLSAESICSSCTKGDFFFDINKSIFLYTGICRDFMHGYKFHKRKHYSKICAAQALALHGGYLNSFDYYVPVTLPGSALFERDFCQVLETVKKISSSTGVRIIKAVKKKGYHSTRAQHLKNKIQRRSDADEQYSFNKKYSGMLSGKKILLIDDILTTGATLNAHARLIRRYCNDVTVSAFTFARTVREENKLVK